MCKYFLVFMNNTLEKRSDKEKEDKKRSKRKRKRKELSPRPGHDPFWSFSRTFYFMRSNSVVMTISR